MDTDLVTEKVNDNGGAADRPDDLEVRFAEPRDAAKICRLFRRIFDEKMTEAHWHWKYDRPQSRAVVVYRGDELLGHYGGVGTDILLEGTPGTAIQITDLMVDPEARHAVRSRSPFFLSGRMFLEKSVGFDKPFLLAFGFPSERAMGLSERLGFFAPVDRMWEAEWKPLKTRVSWRDRIVPLKREDFDKNAENIDALWQAFSKQFPGHIVCRKDAAWFRWRFLDHPDKNYSLYLIRGRFGGKARALIAMRHDRHKSMLMDFVSPGLDVETVVAHARNIAARQGKRRLLTWCSDAFRDRFEIPGAELKPLPVIIPACTASKGPDPETQQGKWWFMPGDTDYL